MARLISLHTLLTYSSVYLPWAVGVTDATVVLTEETFGVKKKRMSVIVRLLSTLRKYLSSELVKQMSPLMMIYRQPS